MLTAKLLKPLRLHSEGRTWERGVKYPIDLTTARVLSKNPRFQVDGLLEALEAIHAGKSLSDLGIRETPVDQTEAPMAEVEGADGGSDDETSGDDDDEEALLDLIREATGELDVDNEDHFTNDGKPTVAALEEKLGVEITAEQRDKAIAPPARQGTLETEGGAEKTAARIKLKSSKPRPTRRASEAPANSSDEPSVEV